MCRHNRQEAESLLGRLPCGKGQENAIAAAIMPTLHFFMFMLKFLLNLILDIRCKGNDIVLFGFIGGP